jgi:hypothetical protein
MPKSRAEMLRALEKLLDEYSAFQRSRPDLPRGNLWGLSQDELEGVVEAFQLHKSRRRAANGKSLSSALTTRGFTDCALATIVPRDATWLLGR